MKKFAKYFCVAVGVLFCYANFVIAEDAYEQSQRIRDWSSGAAQNPNLEDARQEAGTGWHSPAPQAPDSYRQGEYNIPHPQMKIERDQ